ncbi:MAG: HAMP domain-containing sensor histidine kinase [Aggregatilineales bacterium]
MIGTADIPCQIAVLPASGESNWESNWMEAIASRLQGTLAAQHEIDRLYDPTFPLDVDAQLLPDVILAAAQPETTAILTRIAHTITNPERPILIVIDERSDGIAMEMQPADLILPPRVDVVVSALRFALRQRAEQLRLARQVDALQQQLSQTQDELQRHQRSADEISVLKNAIINTVSHELQTPMLHTKAAIGLLAEDFPAVTLIKYALEATSRLEAIITNVSQLAQSLNITLGAVIPRDAVETAIRRLSRSWQHKDNVHRVKIDIAARLSPVIADHQGLSSVLYLLIDNALKFSAEDVIVRVRGVGNEVEFRVLDFGIGMTKAQIDRIFDPFFQIDHADTRKFSGAGVGLAIVRIILDHHHSSIIVESQRSEGSIFRFRLPCAKLMPLTDYSEDHEINR